ncbi:MAG: hypothetical protein ACPG77_01165 [Nannocystaceae bacterium]
MTKRDRDKPGSTHTGEAYRNLYLREWALVWESCAMSRFAPNPVSTARPLVSAVGMLVAAMFLTSCGGPSKPKNWAPADSNAVAEQTTTDTTTGPEPASNDVTAGPVLKTPVKKKPRELWAQHNAKRLDELAPKIELSADERTKIEAMWAKERTEILRLMLTERSQPKPNWQHVQDTVAGMRDDNDTQVQSWLGNARFEAYKEIRPQGPSLPKPKAPEKTEPRDSDDPDGA